MPPDFPFYNGRPVAFSGRQWLLLIAALVAGFLALTATQQRFPTGLASFVPGLLFLGIPLATLVFVTPQHWTALFRRPGRRDFGWMVGFGLLNIAIAFSVGAAVQLFVPPTPNPAIALLAGMTVGERVVFLLRTLPQLLGEEVFSTLPFLAVLHLLHARAGVSRRTAIIGAWMLSALWFGAAHLPTYGWNFVQCMLVISTARLVLTLSYMVTRNLWVSTGAHILHDWLLFGMAMASQAVQGGAGT